MRLWNVETGDELGNYSQATGGGVYTVVAAATAVMCLPDTVTAKESPGIWMLPLGIVFGSLETRVLFPTSGRFAPVTEVYRQQCAVVERRNG